MRRVLSKALHRPGRLFLGLVAAAGVWAIPAFALAGPGAAGHEHHHDHGATDAHAAQMQTLLKRVPVKAQKAKNPVKDTPEGQAKAKELYAKNCAVCHGEGGKGDGPAAAGLPTKPADFTDAEHQKFYTEGTMYWVVTNGWKGERDAGIRQDDSERRPLAPGPAHPLVFPASSRYETR